MIALHIEEAVAEMIAGGGQTLAPMVILEEVWTMLAHEGVGLLSVGDDRSG